MVFWPREVRASLNRETSNVKRERTRDWVISSLFSSLPHFIFRPFINSINPINLLTRHLVNWSTCQFPSSFLISHSSFLISGEMQAGRWFGEMCRFLSGLVLSGAEGGK